MSGVNSPVLGAQDLKIKKVVTLGPAGTDAHHVATQFGEVELVGTFPQAMEAAWHQNVHALICPGYVQQYEDHIVDTWVSLHFRYLGRMEVQHVWNAPTKPMCAAVNMTKVSRLADARTVALHPSTAAFAEQYLPQARRLFVPAKPLAVEAAAAGEACACIGSEDVIAKYSQLTVLARFQPQMLWCLYHPTTDTELLVHGGLIVS